MDWNGRKAAISFSSVLNDLGCTFELFVMSQLAGRRKLSI